jgi:hypothetical protein
LLEDVSNALARIYCHIGKDREERRTDTEPVIKEEEKE